MNPNNSSLVKFSTSAPILFPRAILVIASDAPPYLRADAASTFPSWLNLYKTSKFFLYFSILIVPSSFFSVKSITNFDPASLNSADTTFAAFSTPTANETSVGGTSKSPKLPDIESLPPIAAISRAICTSYAPSNAANGLPHLEESFPSFSKYSWNVK